MTPHGPDKESFERETNRENDEPVQIKSTLAFMFESSFLFYVTTWAQEHYLQDEYWKCWQNLENHFRKQLLNKED